MKKRPPSGCVGLIFGFLGSLRVSAVCVGESVSLNHGLHSECNAWVYIYGALGGSKLTVNTPVCETDPCNANCRRVECNANNTHIKKIKLQLGDATGTLQPDQWKNFTQLEEISIGDNPGLRDTPIPPQWAALTQLTKLEVTNSKHGTGAAGFLTGVLPPEWERLTKLNTLSLSGQTKVGGPLPVTWSAMRELSVLNLDKTQVNGTLPAQWSGMAKLKQLSLKGPGSIEGSLPPSWGGMEQLRSIIAPNHRLQGSLPVA